MMLLFTNTIKTDKSTSKPTTSNSKDKSNTSILNKELESNGIATTEYYVITTKEPFEICEFNSTCNITDLFNSTDGEILISNFSEKIPIIKNYQVSQKYCSCDLKVGYLILQRQKPS